MMKSTSSRAHVRQILSHMITNAVPIDQFSLMKLVDMSVSSSLSTSSSSLFSHMPPDSIDSDLCNCIIKRYNQLKKYVHSIFVFTQMRKIGLSPKDSTVPSVLKAVSHLRGGFLGQCIHCCVIHKGLQSTIYIATALVSMYFSCSLLIDARKLFDEMPTRNLVSWNALITGYTQSRKFSNAIDVFREMQQSGLEPDEFTLVAVLSACAHLGALNQGKWIHDYYVRDNIKLGFLNLFVGTGLIDMYLKCGVIDKAEEVFNDMKEKDIYAWNVLIFGYAMNGYGKSALKALSIMIRENVKPDHVTFLGLLCACCHQGLADEGRRLFNAMQCDFGVRPWIQHYGCMVDLLGRTGFLDEAHDLILRMDMEPDPIIWRALIGACRIHRNMHLGEFAARKLLKMEPNNGENYVLLSNLYSLNGRWIEVEQVRKKMDERRIRKVPGCSSIEIDDSVYEFKASDITRSGFEDVYRQLVDMERTIRVWGYASDTRMALFDVEEEEKVQSVMYHSEKISLAFGIMKTPANSNLRIIKNLRVCEDCHGFFKIVSKVYERDISLRDRNRFHHFAKGACSCRDFW